VIPEGVDRRKVAIPAGFYQSRSLSSGPPPLDPLRTAVVDAKRLASARAVPGTDHDVILIPLAQELDPQRWLDRKRACTCASGKCACRGTPRSGAG